MSRDQRNQQARTHVARGLTRAHDIVPPLPRANTVVMAPLAPIEHQMLANHGLEFDGVTPVDGGFAALAHGRLGRRAETFGTSPSQATAKLIRMVLG